jgi:hypothetical protein
MTGPFAFTALTISGSITLSLAARVAGQWWDTRGLRRARKHPAPGHNGMSLPPPAPGTTTRAPGVGGVPPSPPTPGTTLTQHADQAIALTRRRRRQPNYHTIAQMEREIFGQAFEHAGGLDTRWRQQPCGCATRNHPPDVLTCPRHAAMRDEILDILQWRQELRTP